MIPYLGESDEGASVVLLHVKVEALPFCSDLPGGREGGVSLGGRGPVTTVTTAVATVTTAVATVTMAVATVTTVVATVTTSHAHCRFCAAVLIDELGELVLKLLQEFPGYGHECLPPGQHGDLEEPPSLVLPQVHVVAAAALHERLTAEREEEEEEEERGELKTDS